MMFSSVTSQKKLDLNAINSHLKKLCLNNTNNYIKDPNVVKCKITYDVACWKETQAGQTVIQRCPFLLFSTKDDISRRCNEQGEWQKMNISKCHRLKPKESVDAGKRAADNSTTDEKDDSLTHAERVKKVYVAFSWVSLFVLLPTFILICIVIRRNDRFTLHKNLILAFILRIITLFIYYYGKMGEMDYNKTVCNAFWMLNRYFAASEITWMLSEGIFLLRMLVYPFDNESYLWYYFLLGWGFSGVLTFCVYLPYVQFTVSRVSERCWVSHSHTSHMLILYVPLTIILMINFGFAIYVVQMLAKKLKNSQSTYMNTIKKSAKAVVILISLLGLIYLLTFYQPTNNPAYNYFVAVVYPLQGIMVCIFCVFASVEFRESLRRYWMKWRYGIKVETHPYSATARDIEPGPSGEHGTSATVLRTESVGETWISASSVRSLRDTSRPTSAQSTKQLLEKLRDRPTQMSLLSRSSDLTKYRLKKVEPEPVKPMRVQSAGPEAWCPPTLQATTAAWGENNSSENQVESSLNRGLENKGFSAKSEADLSRLGSQNSLEPKTTSHVHLETVTKDSEEHNALVDEFPFSSQLFEHDIRPSTAECSKETAGSSASPATETELVRADSSNSKDEFSLSSQLFELDTRPSTAEPVSDGETLTTTAGSSIYQDAEPSTSAEDQDVSPRGKRFWEKARKLAAKRRRSRLEQNRVLSNEGESLPVQHKYAEKQKEADAYKLAWIASILRGERSHEKESDA